MKMKDEETVYKLDKLTEDDVIAEADETIDELAVKDMAKIAEKFNNIGSSCAHSADEIKKAIAISEEAVEQFGKTPDGNDLDPQELNQIFAECYEIDINQADSIESPKILDSGNRREFESGAVRDIQEGKGRCDLLPLDVIDSLTGDRALGKIYEFQKDGHAYYLFKAIEEFLEIHDEWNMYTAILEVAKHFEEGCKKYGERNWQKGIPVRCYIDSAVRHYLKHKRGDTDEPHDRAFIWNILCAIWTCKHKPELNEYAKKEIKKT